MKLKTYLLALGITSSILPVAMQGAELLDGNNGGGTNPRAEQRSMPLVIIEVEYGVIDLHFTNDIGEVTIELQTTAGAAILNKKINTAVQNGDSFRVRAGTYTLTVTTADGANLVEECIVIP